MANNTWLVLMNDGFHIPSKICFSLIMKCWSYPKFEAFRLKIINSVVNVIAPPPNKYWTVLFLKGCSECLPNFHYPHHPPKLHNSLFYVSSTSMLPSCYLIHYSFSSSAVTCLLQYYNIVHTDNQELLLLQQGAGLSPTQWFFTRTPPRGRE